MFVYDAANAETCPLSSPVHRLLKLDVHHHTHQELYSETETHAYTDTQIHYYILKKAYRSGADCNSCCPEFYSKSVVIKSL